MGVWERMEEGWMNTATSERSGEEVCSNLVDGEKGEVGDVDCAFGGAREGGWIGVEGVVDGDLVYESCGGELLEG